jgi:hypothetical protein
MQGYRQTGLSALRTKLCGMGNYWNLYIAGVGPIGTARTMLTNFVGKLRGLGLQITSAEVVDGPLHTDLNKIDKFEEAGWTMNVYGTGNLQLAFNEFPDFLKEFKSQGLNVQYSGVIEGARQNVPVAA